MTSMAYDALEYFEKLKAAGVPEQQAKVQADEMRQHTQATAQAIKEAINQYDTSTRNEVATKGDINDVRLEIQGVRREVQDVRLEMQDVRLEIQKVKFDLLKWQIGGWIAMAAIMAKGFGWLGF